MDNDNLQKLLPYLNHENSLRRAGVIMLVKNCCFELGNFLTFVLYIYLYQL